MFPTNIIVYRMLDRQMTNHFKPILSAKIT